MSIPVYGIFLQNRPAKRPLIVTQTAKNWWKIYRVVFAIIKENFMHKFLDRKAAKILLHLYIPIWKWHLTLCFTILRAAYQNMLE